MRFWNAAQLAGTRRFVLGGSSSKAVAMFKGQRLEPNQVAFECDRADLNHRGEPTSRRLISIVDTPSKNSRSTPLSGSMKPVLIA